MNGIKESLATTAEPRAEQVVTAIDQIPLLSERISKVEQQLTTIEAKENPLQETVDELNAKINMLLDNTRSFVGQNTRLIQEIDKKEEEILASPVLNEKQKEALADTFSKNIDYWLPSIVLDYYGSLVQLDTLLQDSLDIDTNYEATVKSINPILGGERGGRKVMG